MIKVKQTDRRTASDRREYMQQYHARRKLQNGNAELLPVPIPAMPKCPPAACVIMFRADDVVRRYLRDGSGRLMWPERRKTHPETLAETLRRARR